MGRVEAALIEAENEVTSWTEHIRKLLRGGMNPFVLSAAMEQSGAMEELSRWIYARMLLLRNMYSAECRWEDDGGPCLE